MKWLLDLFKKEERLKLGDKVISSGNIYGQGIECEIVRVYDRDCSGTRIKYCKLEFKYHEFTRSINVTYKSCKKVNLG